MKHIYHLALMFLAWILMGSSLAQESNIDASDKFFMQLPSEVKAAGEAGAFAEEKARQKADARIAKLKAKMEAKAEAARQRTEQKIKADAERQAAAETQQHAEADAAQMPVSSPEILVERWVKDWAGKNVEGYLSHYDIEFRPENGKDREGWKAKRRSRIGEAASIKVHVDNLKIERQSELKATARFVETIEVGSYKKTSQKQLLLIRRDRDGDWRIREEREETKAELSRAKAEEIARLEAEANAARIKIREKNKAEESLAHAPASKEQLDGVDWSGQKFWLVETPDMLDRDAVTVAWRSLHARFPKQMENRTILPRRQGVMRDAGEEPVVQYQLFIANFPEKQVADELCAMLRAEQQRCSVVPSQSLAGRDFLNATLASYKGNSNQNIQAGPETEAALLKPEQEAQVTNEEKARRAAEARIAKLKAEQEAKTEAARQKAEQQAKVAAEKQALAEEKARQEAEARVLKLKAKMEAKAEAARLKTEQEAQAQAERQIPVVVESAPLKAAEIETTAEDPVRQEHVFHRLEKQKTKAEAARQKVEQQAKAQAEKQAVAEEKARQEAEARVLKLKAKMEAKAETARLKAEQAAKAQAEKQALAEAKQAEAARSKAEQLVQAATEVEPARLNVEQEVEEKARQEAEARVAKLKAKEEARAEVARLKAEQAAKAQAEKQALAEAKAEAAKQKAEQQAKAQAEKQAAAEEKARQEAEARVTKLKAKDEARAEVARLKAEQEAEARAKKQALAEAKAEAARQKAEQQAKAEAEKQAAAEEKARQEAEVRAVKLKAREEAKAEAARLQAEQAAKAQAEKQALVEVKQEQAVMEVEPARLNVEQEVEEKARQEAEAKIAKLKAREEAKAEAVRLKAEQEAKARAKKQALVEAKAEAARQKAEQQAKVAAEKQAVAETKKIAKAAAAKLKAEQKAQAQAEKQAAAEAKRAAKAEAVRLNAELEARVAAEEKVALLKNEQEVQAVVARADAENKGRDGGAVAVEARRVAEAETETARVNAEKKARTDAQVAEAETKAAKLEVQKGVVEDFAENIARLKAEQKAKADAQAATGAKAAKLKAARSDMLVDFVQKAVLTNPDVLSRWHTFKAAISETTAARGGYLPRVDMTVDRGRERGQSQTNNYTSNTENITFTLTQMLYDGLATRNEVGRLNNAQLARYYELLDASETAALEAVRVFYDVTRHRKLFELTEDNYVRHRTAFEQIKLKVEAGVGRRVDLEQAGGRLALSESNLTVDNANVHDVSARFQRVIGELPPASLRKSPSQDKLAKQVLPNAAAAVLSVAVDYHPAILAAVENVRSARYDLYGRWAKYQPTVNLSIAQTHSKNLAGVDGATGNATAKVTLNWNLFSGGSDSARSTQYAGRLDAARDLRDKACRDIRMNLAIAYNDIWKLQEQLNYLDQHQLSIEKARGAYQKQFDIGQRSLLDLLDTENELYQAKRSYVNAEYDLAIAHARTLAGMGRLVSSLGIAHLETADLPELLGISSDAPESCPPEAPIASNIRKDELDARAIEEAKAAIEATRAKAEAEKEKKEAEDKEFLMTPGEARAAKLKEEQDAKAGGVESVRQKVEQEPEKKAKQAVEPKTAKTPKAAKVKDEIKVEAVVPRVGQKAKALSSP